MSATIEHITLSVPDVSCAHCVASVDEAVSGIDGVSTVTTDIGSKQVAVGLNPEKVSVAQVIAALDEAGYPASQTSAS